ncbi:hypothetical protein FB645_001666 [Coemansia sp. IMI 203386]|nr:hypothetical protein FB645_001666 [Coemansia sp. IMI 203386]
MDINDIFKETVSSTTLNVGKGKRKLGDAPSLSRLKERGYVVENEDGDSANASKRAKTDTSDIDANADSIDDDDEGGRFFSDGLSTKQKGVLQWVDNAEDVEESLDKAAVQRLVSRMERAMSRNTEERIRHAQSPLDFAESEADLDEALRALAPLANDVLLLHVLDDLDAIPTLVELLAHENEDISLDVVDFVNELTAMDAWSQNGESQEERQAVVRFVKALQRNEFFEALGEILRRLDENTQSEYNQDDASGVAKALDIVDNLTTLDPGLARSAATSMKLLDWLQMRIAKDSQGTVSVDANQQYAAEITAVLLQTSPETCLAAADSLLVEALLKRLSKYRKRTPEDAAEIEFVENIVDAICVLVSTRKGKKAFEMLEGVELLVLMQKQQGICRLLSLKILDYALSPPNVLYEEEEEEEQRNDANFNYVSTQKDIAKRYIDNVGLKYLFYVLTRRGKGSVKKLYKDYPESDERAVSCISWLFRLTERDTPLHWRIMAKFVSTPADETSWKLHIDRLVELNIQYHESLRETEDRINNDDDDGDDNEEKYLTRQEAGLYSLQMSDIVIAFVAMDKSARLRVEQRLRRKGRTLDDVAKELAEYVAVKQASSLSSIGSTSGAKSAAASGSGSNPTSADLDHMLSLL